MRSWRRRAPWTIGLLASGFAACTGVIEDPTSGVATGGPSAGTPPVPASIDFRCDPADRAPDLALVRLTGSQLTRAVSALVVESLPAGMASEVLGELQAAFEAYPEAEVAVTNGSHGGFRRADQALQGEHVSASIAMAQALGQALTRTPARIVALLGGCATDGDAGNDGACLRDFIARFGRLAERAPLDPADVEFYEGVYGVEGIVPEALADVIGTFAASPRLHYLVETGDEETAADRVSLAPHELAARLALQLWDGVPDAELRAAADDGSLLTGEVYRAQVRRLLDDPRAETPVRRFYEEWFWLTDPPSIAAFKGDPVFDAVRGDFDPGDTLHLEMRDEVIDMAVYYTLQVEGGIAELYGSDRSFARSPQVAAIYGVEPWDGVSEPPAFEDPARRGILTRAAFVVGNSNITHPILKGVHARIGLLCDPIPDPPPSSMENLPMLSVDLTAREQAEQLTEVEGSECVQCHTAINPIGMLTENFDILGRFRETEPVFASDGTLLVEPPVYTVATPRFHQTDTREFEHAAQAVDALVESGKPAACFARTYLRFSFGRAEDERRDGCVLQEMNEALRSGGSLRTAIETFVTSSRFRERVVAEPTEGE